MRIYDLIVEEGREEHIARHGVRVSEVEDVAYGDPLVSRSRQDRLRLIGQTEGGRYLAIFLAPRGAGAYTLVTARDATAAARDVYHQQKRRY